MLFGLCNSSNDHRECSFCGRNYIGSELDTSYAEVARQRALEYDSEEVEPVYLWINGRLEEV